MTTDFGTDIRCVFDADEILSSASGLDVVYQDQVHRLLTDSVLGNDDWGFDVRRLLGLPQAVALQYGPILEEVLTRDPRVISVSVVLTFTKRTGALAVAVVGRTAQGPFSFVIRVSQTPDGSFHVEV